MRLADLQYELPPERIAQRPVEPRDAARLLVLERTTGRIEHRTFRDLTDYLRADDCLVLNNTRVIPARFFGRRPTGGRVEVFFLREAQGGWRVLLRPAGRVRAGERLECVGATEQRLVLLERAERGEWVVQPEPPVEALPLLERIGSPPLPPYIRLDSAGRENAPDAADRQQYQTVYAVRPGAVAAPTAGMHFTPELLEALRGQGVRRAEVTLHVGLGTFAPIEVEVLAEHRMHAEWYDAPPAALQTLREAQAAGGRIVAVGTTSVRVLESLPALCAARISAVTPPQAETPSASGWTDIFLYPPYEFRNVGALITNFHLPGSTLLALVMAFASPELIRQAYETAIEQEYRFYSYGDAMLIL